MILFFSFSFPVFLEAHLISLYFCSNFPLITHSILTFFCSVLMNRSFYFFQQIFWKEQWLLNIFRSCIWTKTITSEQSCHRFLRSQWCNLSCFFFHSVNFESEVPVSFLETFSFSNFTTFFYNRFWIWRFLLLDYFHLLGRDIETIRVILWFSEDVDDISVVLSIKSMPLLIIDYASWLKIALLLFFLSVPFSKFLCLSEVIYLSFTLLSKIFLVFLHFFSALCAPFVSQPLFLSSLNRKTFN